MMPSINAQSVFSVVLAIISTIESFDLSSNKKSYQSIPILPLKSLVTFLTASIKAAKKVTKLLTIYSAAKLFANNNVKVFA